MAVYFCVVWPKGLFYVDNTTEGIFPQALERSSNPTNKLILQDVNTSQINRKANPSFSIIGCKIFSVAQSSPDPTSIENLYNIFRGKLKQLT